MTINLAFLNPRFKMSADNCWLLLPKFCDFSFEELPDKCNGEGFSEGELDGPFRHSVSPEPFSVQTPYPFAHRIKAHVLFPGRIPYKRLSVKPHSGYSIAEMLDGVGSY